MAFTLGYSAHALLAPPVKTVGATGRRSISSSSRSEKKGAAPSSSGSDASSDIGASDSDSDAEDEAAALVSDIASVKANLVEEVKLVLVVNDELKMSKGKIAAQAGHATLACALMLKDINPKVSAMGRDPQSVNLYWITVMEKPNAEAIEKKKHAGMTY